MALQLTLLAKEDKFMFLCNLEDRILFFNVTVSIFITLMKKPLFLREMQMIVADHHKGEHKMKMNIPTTNFVLENSLKWSGNNNLFLEFTTIKLTHALQFQIHSHNNT